MIRHLAALAAAPLLAAGLAAAQPAAPTAPAASPPAAAAASPARRAPSAAQEAQQQRMRGCNAQAGERSLRGDARRAFMRECLSASRSQPARAPAPTLAESPPRATAASPAAPGAETRQARMRDCNAQARARDLRGDARRAFMGQCLGGANAVAPAVPAGSPRG